MKWLAALLVLMPSLAFAQGAPRQNGPVVPFDIAGFVADLTLETASKTLEDYSRGFNPFTVTDSNGLGITLNNALTNGTYHSLSFGHDGGGNPIFNVDGTNYPFLGIGSGNVVGPNSSAVGEMPLFNSTTGVLLKSSGWIDNGTRLTGPSGRTLTVSGQGALQVAGVTGPLAFAIPGFEDTFIIQALPGAAPSGDTTNVQLFPSIASAAGKAYLNIGANAAPGAEERLIIGYNGAGTYTYTSFQLGGTAYPQCFIDGTGADITGCFMPRAGGAGTYPYLLLGAGVGIFGGNVAHGSQEWLRMDATDRLLVGAGANIASIVVSHQVTLPNVSTGTPVASLCIDASNNIIKKTTAGACI